MTSTSELSTERVLSAEKAIRAIVDLAPMEEQSQTGVRLRCQQCGHAWLKFDVAHHAPTCAYVIAVKASLESVPVELPSIGPGDFLPLNDCDRTSILQSMVEGLHAIVYGTYSIQSGDYALKSLGDGGELHEYVHAMLRLLPQRGVGTQIQSGGDR